MSPFTKRTKPPPGTGGGGEEEIADGTRLVKRFSAEKKPCGVSWLTRRRRNIGDDDRMSWFQIRLTVNEPTSASTSETLSVVEVAGSYVCVEAVDEAKRDEGRTRAKRTSDELRDQMLLSGEL